MTAWSGWTEEGAPPRMGEGAAELLRAELGDTEPWPRPTAPEEVALPAPAGIGASGAKSDWMRALERHGQPDTSHFARLTHATGMGYLDLARIRERSIARAPDAVLCPGDAAELEWLLACCAAEGVAVVPYGGGTSVVGGIEALRGDHDAVVSLDLSRLRAVSVDAESLTANLGAGLDGPSAEAALAPHRLTLGHFPQSFERATIGGYAATRSAGQASVGYGRFDELVTGISAVSLDGRLELSRTPHTAAGPSVRELLLGSEGTLGVITRVRARVRPVPEARRYEAWAAGSFEEGREAVRELLQRGQPPDIVRLSDAEETRINLAMAGGGLATRALDGYLRLRGMRAPCLLILGFEGADADVASRRAGTAGQLRRAGLAYIGRRAGEAWEHGRYSGPYLRDEILDRGVMAETLETAHDWSGLGRLHSEVGRAIRGALSAGGERCVVMCHLSHAYRDGASLYFTFLAPVRRQDPEGQWREVKNAAGDAIAAAGGTITHHHAVGRDHAPWLEGEIGEAGIRALGALKRQMDPSAILNPGKLLPPPG